MSCRCCTAVETGQRPASRSSDEKIEQQQVGVDAVALGQVHAEAVAAGLLATHHRAGLDHLGTRRT